MGLGRSPRTCSRPAHIGSQPGLSTSSARQRPVPVTIVPTLVVDTVTPVITNVSFDRLRRDAVSDLQGQPERDGPGESQQLGVLSHFGQAIVEEGTSTEADPTDVHPFSSDGNPTDPVAVKVVFNKRTFDARGQVPGGRRFWYGRPRDTGRCGQCLGGDYYGRFPTGDRLPGGDFVATIATFHNRVLAGVPIKNGYVPPSAARRSSGWRLAGHSARAEPHRATEVVVAKHGERKAHGPWSTTRPCMPSRSDRRST